VAHWAAIKRDTRLIIVNMPQPARAGQLYHLDFDPPPANNPGLCERLEHPPGQDIEAGKVTLEHMHG